LLQESLDHLPHFADELAGRGGQEEELNAAFMAALKFGYASSLSTEDYLASRGGLP
jgi:hypothetical protein